MGCISSKDKGNQNKGKGKTAMTNIKNVKKSGGEQDIDAKNGQN